MYAQEAKELSKKFDVKQAAEKWIEENVNNEIKNKASDGFRFVSILNLPSENIEGKVYEILRSRGYMLEITYSAICIEW